MAELLKEVQMVAPLLRTLVRLHEQHILHRDIKPENIFLTGSQRFKLGDFGLAIQSNLELPYTRSGTLDYLSPEVIKGHKKGLPWVDRLPAASKSSTHPDILLQIT